MKSTAVTIEAMAQRRLLGAGILLLLAALGYGHLCQPGQVLYSPHSDFIAEHLATKTVLYDAIHRQGRMPFWRGDELAGNTALTNPQSLYTYPLHVLFYFMAPVAAWGPTVGLHFLAAGLAYYLLGASMGVGWGARLLMAVAGLFQFKLLMAAYAGWLPVMPIVVFFPLLFASVFHLLKRPGLGGVLALAGAMALCLHSGQMQLIFYSGGFLGVYVVIYGGERVRQQAWAELWPRLLSLVGGTALGIGASLYLLGPVAVEAPWLSRSKTTYEFLLAGHSLRPAHLLTLFYPEALGTPLEGTYPGDELWEDVAYFGLIPLLLGGVGVVLGWRRRPTRFLAAGFLVSLLLAADTPVLRFLYEYLPLFGLFRVPNRFLFLVAFFGLALAGIGADQVLSRLASARRAVVSPAMLVTILVLLIGGEGIYYAHRYLFTVPQEQVLPSEATRRYFRDDPDLFRVAPLGRATLNYGWSASLGVQLVCGFDPYNLRGYQQYFDLLRFGRPGPATARVWTDLTQVARWDLLDALNVKYLVASSPLPNLPGDRFELAARLPEQRAFVFYQGLARGDLYIYRNQRFRPRAFWADGVVGGVQRAGDDVPDAGATAGGNGGGAGWANAGDCVHGIAGGSGEDHRGGRRIPAPACHQRLQAVPGSQRSVAPRLAGGAGQATGRGSSRECRADGGVGAGGGTRFGRAFSAGVLGGVAGHQHRQRRRVPDSAGDVPDGLRAPLYFFEAGGSRDSMSRAISLATACSETITSSAPNRRHCMPVDVKWQRAIKSMLGLRWRAMPMVSRTIFSLGIARTSRVACSMPACIKTSALRTSPRIIRRPMREQRSTICELVSMTQ